MVLWFMNYGLLEFVVSVYVLVWVSHGMDLILVV